jgi:hypothetical protein
MAQQETPVDVAARHAADHADVEGRHAADHAEIVAEASGSARGDLRPAQQRARGARGAARCRARESGGGDHQGPPCLPVDAVNRSSRTWATRPRSGKPRAGPCDTTPDGIAGHAYEHR